jgi:hypothetical protein
LLKVACAVVRDSCVLLLRVFCVKAVGYGRLIVLR